MAATAMVRRIGGVAVALAVLGGVVWLAVVRANSEPAPGTLFGNVEIRQVDLAFNAEGTLQIGRAHV